VYTPSHTVLPGGLACADTIADPTAVTNSADVRRKRERRIVKPAS
jgi:hypothetical protein